MSTQNLLSIRGLKKYFPAGGGFGKNRRYLRANDGISLDIKAGETFALVGESGSGKSTLGKTVLSLQKPTEGEIIYFGRNVNEFAPAYLKKSQNDEREGINLTLLSGAEMRKLRRDLQIVFQDPYSSLNPRMTVGQIVEEGVAAHKFYKKGSGQMREYVREVMQACGLQSDAYYRYPHQFSGGQRQRVCIARALAVKPKFVVCDECVSALDCSIQSQILNLLTDLKEREKLTYLFISHDLSVVRHIADKVAVMYLGRIVEQGSVKQVFDDPRHPYTIALLSAAPTIDRKKREQIILGGHIPSPVSPPSGCPFHTRCFMAKEECRRVPAPLQETESGHFSACHFAPMTAKDKKKIAQRREGLSS